ncbi:MAG: hypothetical protein ACOYNS_17060 [Bacteroidota bacterium]
MERMMSRDNSMEWEVIIHREMNYLEIVTAGTADNASSTDMATSIAEIMRKNRITKVLIDHRSVDVVTGNTLEVYERPKLFRFIGMILGIRMAALIHQDHTEHFKFLEAVCLNQGYTYSVFYDRSKAVEWLLV